ncbi:VCBS repeat-containing protein, partial [bacterium]
MRRTVAMHLLPITLVAFLTGLIIVAPSVRGLQQSPAPTAPHHEPTGLVPHAIAVGDFNGDGVPDIAIPAAA